MRDTGIEPVTSSVSGKRSPAELIAPGKQIWRWRRESNPCARLCRPLPHHSATPPLGLMRLHPRADDGIRTRDPHLGKVMRYQLRYIRTPRTRSSPGAKHDDSPPERDRTNSSVTMGAPRIDRRQRVLPQRRLVLTFDVARLGIRSRSSAEERPPHTREVAGSNPAGTTTYAPSALHRHCLLTTSTGFPSRRCGDVYSGAVSNHGDPQLLRHEVGENGQRRS